MMFEAMAFKFKTSHIKHQTFNIKLKKRLFDSLFFFRRYKYGNKSRFNRYHRREPPGIG